MCEFILFLCLLSAPLDEVFLFLGIFVLFLGIFELFKDLFIMKLPITNRFLETI